MNLKLRMGGRPAPLSYMLLRGDMFLTPFILRPSVETYMFVSAIYWLTGRP